MHDLYLYIHQYVFFYNSAIVNTTRNEDMKSSLENVNTDKVPFKILHCTACPTNFLQNPGSTFRSEKQLSEGIFIFFDHSLYKHWFV